MNRLLFSVAALSLGFSLACTGVGGPAAPPSGRDAYDVTYKRYQNMFEQSEVLDFVGADRVQIYYGGRFDQRTTRVGTWEQNGTAITLTLEPLEGKAEAHSVEVHLHQTGKCSLALYHRVKSDGSTWSSGQEAKEGNGYEQPQLYKQNWPPCEAPTL